MKLISLMRKQKFKELIFINEQEQKIIDNEEGKEWSQKKQ